MRACKNCFNSKVKMAQLQQNPLRECHLNPPTVCSGAQGLQAAWPVVADDDFCGSFEPSASYAINGDAPKVSASAITRPPVDPALRPSEKADKVVGG